MAAASILVVEDEFAIQELIAVNLEHAGHTVLRAASAAQALELIRESLPDLVLLDWMLPDRPGVEFARQLRADRRTRDIPIIMLTARAQEQDKVSGLESGADDYVTKPFSSRELLARIQAVLRRRAPELAGEILEINGLALDPVSHRVTARGASVDLTPTEFQLLRFFMAHPERVYTRQQLLDQIWVDHVFVDERTVDVHIRRLRKALEPTALADLVETVHGTGYRFRNDQP
ncbi:MAG TPA: phosphate regulon transcriptional regulator PhoB [Burkholderiales bacterium]|nr:phosphate regulon transcriptional regulator PhoB [Burkholderiales bacterium]